MSTLDVRLRLTASVTRDTFIFAINKDRADHGWLVSRSNHAETRLVTNQRLHSVRVHRTEDLAYCSGTAIHARTTHCSLTIYGQGFRSTRCYPPAEAKGGYERERERESFCLHGDVKVVRGKPVVGPCDDGGLLQYLNWHESRVDTVEWRCWTNAFLPLNYMGLTIARDQFHGLVLLPIRCESLL